MHFMSIEAAAQMFLFAPRAKSSFDEESYSAWEQERGLAQTEIPFFHNHLHDLESLWWVAVWMVFHNHISEAEPSFTLPDVKHRLDQARKLFPPAFNYDTRLLGFQTQAFLKACAGLPDDKTAIYKSLDHLRQVLIDDYESIEARYPFIDLNASQVDIYGMFTKIFTTIKTHSDGLVLHSIPAIYATLLNPKRPRSESTNDTGVVQKVARK